MMRSLISGISGLTSFQKSMDVIGNNISNVNTSGFKAGRVTFADTLSQKVGSASGPGTATKQIGLGVDTHTVHNIFSDGGIQRTGRPEDLAISGKGFFVVKDPINDEDFVTRSGEFNIDSNGFLIAPSGHRVQGFNNSELNVIGDLKIDATQKPDTSKPDATLRGFSITQDGKINIFLSDGTEYIRGQVLLQNLVAPESLNKAGNNLYTGYKHAGPLDWDTTPGTPGNAGTGQILSERLELSNVELSQEFSNMITTQRAYQASARIISTSDEMLQELVNMKR